MSTFVDNTGVDSLVEIAGIIWVETKYSSYTSRRSADGRFYVGETSKRFYRLKVRNAETGEFDTRSDVGIAFSKAREAQLFAAALVESEVAA